MSDEATQLTRRQQELFESLVEIAALRGIVVGLSRDGKYVVYKNEDGRQIAREAVSVVLSL